MKNELQTEGALTGYRVLDLAEGGCLICGKILGDLGADVLKIEKPGGAPTRSIGPFYKDIPDPEKSIFWFAYNTNKRSITLDIQTKEGKGIFAKLVKTADFVIESFPPEYMDNFGIGYTMCSQINSRIIMTSITPFGQTGPYAHLKASDLTSWAMGGFLYVCGDSDRAPTWITFPQASLHGGTQAAAASLIAHWHRELTGEGQHVDVSIQECVVNLVMNATPLWDLIKFIVPRIGNVWMLGSVLIPMGYRCKDGYVSLFMLGGGAKGMVASSQALVAWMDEEGMAPDWLKEFDWVIKWDATSISQESVNHVRESIARFFLTKTKQELLEGALQRHIFLAPMCTTEDVWKNPHLAARDFWAQVEHPELGDTVRYCGDFIKMSETPCGIRRRAPLIGEHNQEIYEGELGFSKDELSALKQLKII
jgi:benzylsuccinate CoA-transferase BbsE subunit